MILHGNNCAMNSPAEPGHTSEGEDAVAAMVLRLRDMGLPERDCVAIGLALFVAYWHGQNDAATAANAMVPA